MTNIDIEEVAREFEMTLVFPQIKPAPQIILCPVGLVGAGKSTVMKPLCETFSLLRIANDDIRLLLGENKYGNETLQIAAQVIEKYARQGFSIGIDSNASTAFHSDRFNKIISELDARVLWIHVNPPEEYILNKLNNYHHGSLFRNKKEAISSYQKSKEVVVTEGIPFVYEFDPSRDDLDKQINEAVVKINQELEK